MLMFGETYFFYVDVQTRYGNGEPSRIKVTTQMIDANVSDLTASVSDKIRVKVQWAPPKGLKPNLILVS